MWRRVPLGVALLVLLTVPATGFGWFGSLFSRSSYRAAPRATVYYYCPAPVFAAVAPAPEPWPSAVTPAPEPWPSAGPPVAPPPLAVPRYAEPRPAPPSGSTVEPPRMPDAMPKAGVNAQESRKASDKFYDSYFVASGARAARERCAVTFWNLSGQGVTLTVDGQSHPLGTGQSLRLDLKHSFAWRVAGRDEERQEVPAQESGVEIVIRR
jgi:hypothetical protein